MPSRVADARIGAVTWAGLVLKNLLRRKVRTGLTVAGVAIGVGLIVALLSITNGVKSTANQLIHVGRSDFGLFQEGASDLTRSVLPQSLFARVKADPGVADAARIFIRVGKVENQKEFLLFGFAPGEFTDRRNVVIAGRRPRGAETLVGDTAAEALRVRPGGFLHIGKRAFRIAGIYHSGDRFVDLGATLPLRVVQAVRIDTSSRLIITAGWIFSLLALIIGGIGVTNTMAMSVFERIREIGIMRAVGWTSTRIAALIVSEALAIGLIALGVGLFGGWGAAVLLTQNSSLSSLAHADFTGGVFAWGLAFALGVGLIGALYPAWRAISLTPIEALRRE
jgi:putative ABC transport system permease protein